MLLYKGGRENDLFRIIYMYFLLGKISINSVFQVLVPWKKSTLPSAFAKIQGTDTADPSLP